MEDLVMRKEALENLSECVHKLDKADQVLIAMIYTEELSHVEVAKRLGIARTTVGDRLKKLHEKIRLCLSPEMQDVGGPE